MSTLFHEVVAITEPYLGPAAERFISRQVESHIQKPPHELSLSDLPKLTEWAKVTFGLLTRDQAMIDEYAEKMTHLARRADAQA